MKKYHTGVGLKSNALMLFFHIALTAVLQVLVKALPQVQYGKKNSTRAWVRD